LLFATVNFEITEALGFKLTDTTDEDKSKTHSDKLDAKIKADSTVNLPDYVRQKINNAPSISTDLKNAYKAKRATDAPDNTSADANYQGGTKAGQNKLPVSMRTKRREPRGVNKTIHLFERFITKLYNNQFLAPSLIVAGGVINYFYAQDNFSSAMITIVTASMAALIFAFRHDPVIQNHEEKKATKLRFEKLEDKAWELSESEERYRSIAEAFDDLLVMRDQSGKILFCNPEFSTSFGKTVLEITNTYFAPVPKHFSNSKEQMDKSNGLGAGLGLETREVAFETNEGLKWFSWLDLPVRGEGNNGAVILSVARDITSYKFAEQTLEEARGKAEQANRAKTRFLAMVSHEMRTPLNGVLGMSKLLNGTNITDEQKTYIDSISSSGSSLLHLIEEMLDITMIEAGRFKLQEKNIDIRQLMSDIVELISPRAYSKNIGLGLFVDSKMPQIVHTDPARLKQIIINLLGNAIKFTQTGGVALQCRVGNIDTFNNTANIIFKVVDTGPGLNPEDQKRIFQEFERVDDENTRNVDGAGLGLAISKAIADQLGGELKLVSSSENGSTFALDLTLNFVPDVNEKTTIRSSLRGKKILLVMNNLMEADCLQKQIKSNGGVVNHIINLAGIKAALKNDDEYDAVIFDPKSFENKDTNAVLDGFTNRIKTFGHKNLSRKKDLQVIVLMDPAERKKLHRLLGKGADAYLIRPVRETSLLNVLSADFIKETAEKEYEEQLNNQVTSQVIEQQLLGKTILLAEDNDINKMLVTACLTKAGAKVEHAANGALAVKLFKASKYDAVLMDMHMPVLDGIAATIEIRNLERDQNITTATKIIALTADDQQSSRQNAFDAGMDDFLQKPIDPTVLVKILKKLTAQ